MDRRTALKLGAGLGALAGTGLYARHRLLPPAPSRVLAPVDELARRLFVGLDDGQRAAACVEYEHPWRQYHNRGVWGGGLGILAGFSRGQRALLTDLLHAGLSPAGRARVPREYFLRWAGVHALRVVVCGDPTSPPYQVILSGPHLNLRLGGRSREGVAFGGPQVYGDQRGNGRAGLPGNLFRDQFLLAEQLYHALDPARRAAARVFEAPIQTQIEVQGRAGARPGIPVAELEPEHRARVSELVGNLLATYPDADAAFARECLAANGGIQALSLAYYEHGEDGAIPPGQVFRLEGPAAVFHFRGHPHVHAFLNVAMDGEAPLSVGEPLGTNPAVLEGDGVKALFEAAMQSELGTDLAYYDRASVVGRLRAGPVRSGDVYVLESWQQRTVVLEIRGARLAPALRTALGPRPLDPGRSYTVATTEHDADERAECLGRIEARRPGPWLRDVTIAHLCTRARAFR